MPPAQRITSLDQFRGYTVAGMFLVNFVGSFAITPTLLTHQNNFCSYADTIMPQFFFAVGFAFRLTFERRAQAEGAARAYGHVAPDTARDSRLVELERKVGQQAVELDFFKEALRHVKAPPQPSAGRGAKASSRSSTR